MTKQGVQSGSGAAAAAAAAVSGHRGVEVTEEQARAIISMAKRAVEEAARISGDGSAAAGKPSLKRSLECFLEARKNKATSSAASRRCRLESSATATSSSSSN